MEIRNRLKTPKGLMSLGTMCLVTAIVWPNIIHPATQFGMNLMEGARGLLFGLSISINLGSVWMGSRQRRCSGN
jgi:hypothetical protein